jgi:hypothetical protein
MRHPLITALGIAVLSAIASPTLSLSVNETVVTEIQFDDRSITVSEREKERLRLFVEQVRSGDWCPLDRVVVVGHANPSEGTPKEALGLSSERVESVIALLHTFGVPRRSTYGEGKGTDFRNGIEPPPSARVEIEFLGMLPYPQCPIPKTTGGFRAR